MSISHFTGVAIFIVALTTAGLVVSAIVEAVAWTTATPVIIILLEIIREGIKRR